MSIHDHLVRHIKHSDLVSDSTLHVVGVISNAARYHSRYRLFREWYERMKVTPNVKVYVVEVAFGDRHHECTETGNPQHLQLRTKHELWHKENMINLAVKHLLPTNWKYLCWADCDVFWPDDGWAMETIQQLQHYEVVQPWQNCADLGFYGEIMQTFDSFCFVNQLGVRKQCHPSEPYKYAHSGFAWACTRRFWEATQGLMDWCIVGSADHHMAWGMTNEIHKSIHGAMSEDFKRRGADWQRNAYRITKGNLGFVKTRLEHKFHGPKKRRYYRERWQMFIDHNLQPSKDLAYDEQGLLYLLNKPALEEEIRRYNRSRHEDSIESQ